MTFVQVHHTTCRLHGTYEGALCTTIVVETCSEPPHEFGAFLDPQ
jgi:hypothetical protein